MNKKEAIEKIKNIEGLTILDSEMIPKKEVLNIANQIDEPKKVVVPQFVAEYIEYCKHWKFYAIHGAYDSMDDKLKFWRFKGDNSELFAKAWLYGYEIEKEKLYRVYIADNLVINDTLTQNKDSGIFTFSIGDGSESELFTKTELKQSGFGWVFDCDGMKVEEVER